MKFLYDDKLESVMLPGRTVREAIGKKGPVLTTAMRVCICEYSEASGPMEAHRHIEEACYVSKSDRAWVRYGSTKDCTEGKVMLTPGMLIHFPDWEWHVFEYEDGGMLELICFYGSTEDRVPPTED